MLFIRFNASAFRKLPSVYLFSYFPFGFEGRTWDLIVSVPDRYLSFYFSVDEGSDQKPESAHTVPVGVWDSAVLHVRVWTVWRNIFYKMSRLMTKPTKLHVRPAKTQISLCMRPVWSESSLSAWRKLGSLATYWVDVQADLSLRWAHMPFCWFCHEMAQIFNGNYCTGTHHSDMSHVTRKPVFGVFNQVRLKPACSATEASLRLDSSDIESRSIILSRQRTTKVLIRLRECADWSAPLLFAYGINRFSHDVAHILITPNWLVGEIVLYSILCLNVPFNNYGHVGMVSLPNHTFPGQADVSS